MAQVISRERRKYRARASPSFLVLASVGLIALGFFYSYAVPYFSLNETTFGPYAWPRRRPLLLHLAAGSVALLVGPAQLWLGLTGSRPQWHRRLGFTYLASVLASSLAAFYLLARSEVGLVFQTGIAGLACAWLVTTGLAFVAIRRGLVEQHREWMVRSYVVTTAFVTFRALSSLLAALQVGTADEQVGLASWFCWAAPLLVTEAVMQSRKMFLSDQFR